MECSLFFSVSLGALEPQHLVPQSDSNVYRQVFFALAGWLVPYTERFRVRSLIGAQAWVVGLLPGRGVYERQPIDVAPSHLCFSLSLKSISMSSGEDERKDGYFPHNIESKSLTVL